MHLQFMVTCMHLIINSDDTNEGTIFTPFNINSTTAMNNFLQDQFVNLTTAELDRIDQFYPKAQQFPGKGAFWRAAANAYGEMRYICPGIYISTMISSHGEQASYNYRYVSLTLNPFAACTNFKPAGMSSPRSTQRAALVSRTPPKSPLSGAPLVHLTMHLSQPCKHTGPLSSEPRIPILINWSQRLSGRLSILLV
jgi:hypothetical protein